MCSQPPSIINKQTGEVHTVACRNCDECIATRRHGWVARAMAEKATARNTICLTLTYDSATQANRDAAAMFDYSDVRDFIKRLSSACAYEARKAKLGFRPSVRFICAGEQGSRNGRCHWHLIIYSDLDLTKVGQFSMKGRAVTRRADMITVGKRKRRLDWSIWGKGFVTIQEPDQAGMNYVLSYCLKDQFTADRSKGTMREAKSEDFATGLFRMSKRPAIGERWLLQKLEALDARGAVLPSTQLQIPGFRGYWHPNGVFREKLLRALVALNQRAVLATGANAPQWSALLASCKESPSDLEILNGTKEERERAEEIVERRSKTLTRYARDWELDSIGEPQRLAAFAQREAIRASLRCLCSACVTETYGRPYHQKTGADWFFFTEGRTAELAGGETILDLWGPKARCEACGSSTGLWAVEPQGSSTYQE